MADISKITLPNGTTYTIKDATARTGSGRVNGTAITVQTGSTTQARITLQTLMAWLITTKAYIPSGTNCYKLLNVSWSYAGNDILRLQAVSATGTNTNYELQLAGCQIEFIGNATDYQTGVFRLRIHSSPTTSFTVSSGYTVFPVNHVAEYTCNGSGYTPVWKIHANLGDVVNTNTWRGIQNNLTSDSTTDSLSAAQGKVLASQAIKNITRSGTTFTATRVDGTTFTFTQQDNNTVYTHPTYTAKSSGLYKITVDGTGHVSAATAVVKADITALGIPGSDTDTHYTTHLYAGSGAAANATTTNGNTKLTVVDNTTVRNTVTLKGSGGTTVSSDASGNVTITTEVATVAETKSYLGIS